MLRSPRPFVSYLPASLGLFLGSIATVGLAHAGGGPATLSTSDPSGLVRTVSTSGPIDQTGAFFQSLGTNGRTCATCHDPNDAWTTTPARIQKRFEETNGQDPLFSSLDGMNSPFDHPSTVEEERQDCSLLLTKGLIRIGLSPPANAEYQVTGVDDPYHAATSTQLSMYRRSLPSTNLGFQSTVLWDGRMDNAGPSIREDLFK